MQSRNPPGHERLNASCCSSRPARNFHREEQWARPPPAPARGGPASICPRRAARPFPFRPGDPQSPRSGCCTIWAAAPWAFNASLSTRCSAANQLASPRARAPSAESAPRAPRQGSARPAQCARAAGLRAAEGGPRAGRLLARAPVFGLQGLFLFTRQGKGRPFDGFIVQCER